MKTGEGIASLFQRAVAMHPLRQWLAGLKALFGTAIAILLLTACSDKPPIVSADTSCERFRYVSANDAQIKVFADNWAVMESYADQIIGNNLEYTKHCLGVAP